VLACVDVDYREQEAVAACLRFRDWPDAVSSDEQVIHLPPAAPYVPGQFYLRELPCLLAALRGRGEPDLAAVIIDSYVWLDGSGKPGLGAHLHEALGRRTPVIGVAKTSFAGSSFAAPVLRGDSKLPLYVTAAGVPVHEAAAFVKSMHGPHRIPTLLKRVDRLCREA
jgi:deoxyribonuclease V